MPKWQGEKFFWDQKNRYKFLIYSKMKYLSVLSVAFGDSTHLLLNKIFLNSVDKHRRKHNGDGKGVDPGPRGSEFKFFLPQLFQDTGKHT